MAPNCTVFNSGCVVAEIETVPAVTFIQREGERDSEKKTDAGLLVVLSPAFAKQKT